MRQVPQYVLIGNGRLARHFRHYFAGLGVAFKTWHRGQKVQILEQSLQKATHILLLISDQAIEPFIDAHLQDSDAVFIHCSGSLVSEKAYGVHPLMTFGISLYAPEFYPQIPLVIDQDAPPFAELLPGLNHPHAYLSTALKPKYHAFCVLAANFSCMLWQKLFRGFEAELQLPKNLAHPFLLRQMSNLLEDPERALTGPLVRNDQVTIQKNLDALAGDAFQAIYQSFITCYQQEKSL